MIQQQDDVGLNYRWFQITRWLPSWPSMSLEPAAENAKTLLPWIWLSTFKLMYLHKTNFFLHRISSSMTFDLQIRLQFWYSSKRNKKATLQVCCWQRHEALLLFLRRTFSCFIFIPPWCVMITGSKNPFSSVGHLLELPRDQGPVPSPTIKGVNQGPVNENRRLECAL